MRIDEIESRKAEIRELINTEGAEFDINALTDEVRSLNAEAEEIRTNAEKETELRAAVAESVKNEIRKEVSKMENEVRTFSVDSPEYRSAWLRNLQGNLTAEERTDYGFTQTGTYATNAIPTLVSDRFFEKMKKLAPMLSEITLLQVAGNIQFVVEGTRNTATKHTENNVVTPAQDTTVSVTLGAYEFMKVVAISKSAQIMSIDAFEGWLVEMLAGDIARAIEDYILNDATNGLAYNVVTATSNSVINTTGNYTFKNIVDTEALLPAAYDAEAKWLTTKKVLWGKIASITNSSGTPIFVPDPRGDRVGRIFGRDVVVSDYATGKSGQNALYLGKLTDIVGNLSDPINVAVSDEAGFAANQRMYRGAACFDSKLAKTDAFVQLVTTV